MSPSPPVPEIEDGKSLLLRDGKNESATVTTQADLSPALAIRVSGKEPAGDAYLTTNAFDGRRRSLDTLSEISTIPADADNGRLLGGSSSTPWRGMRQPPGPSGRIERWKLHLKAFWAQNRGLVLVMLSQFFGAVMNGTTRLLETAREDGKGMHPFQILFARMSVTVVLSTLYMWKTNVPYFPFGARDVRWLLVLRGLTGFFGVYGIYYSLLYLPLAEATVLTFLSPIVSCIACSFLIHEPFTRKQQIAALFSLFGVVLIARPTALFSSSSAATPGIATGNSDALSPSNSTAPATPYTPPEPTPSQRLAAVLVGLLGVLGAGGAYTTIRWIGPRAHPLISVNYFATWCTIVSTVSLIFVPGITFQLPHGLQEWVLLTLLGICGFIMQFLLTTGLSSDPSSRATNMVYTQMLFALAIDKAVFGTTPGVLSIFGSSLILGSAIYIALHKEAAKKGPVKPDEERGLVSPEGGAADDQEESGDEEANGGGDGDGDGGRGTAGEEGSREDSEDGVERREGDGDGSKENSPGFATVHVVGASTSAPAHTHAHEDGNGNGNGN